MCVCVCVCICKSRKPCGVDSFFFFCGGGGGESGTQPTCGAYQDL